MKINKTFFTIIVALLVVMPSSAKSVREMWLSMPDTIISFVSKSQRIELVDLIDMKIKPDVSNKLRGNTSIDTLTTDYLKVSITANSVLEMRMLPYKGDSLLCVVHTFMGPEKESEVTFYDGEWKKMEINIPDVQLIQRPDTMQENRYEELCRLIEPRMVYAELSPSEETVTSSLSLPLLGKDEKSSLKDVVMQKKLKWDGKNFKEY